LIAAKSNSLFLPVKLKGFAGIKRARQNLPEGNRNSDERDLRVWLFSAANTGIKVI